jgi:hypothetical protein
VTSPVNPVDPVGPVGSDSPAHDVVELLQADRELTSEEITFLLETAKG